MTLCSILVLFREHRGWKSQDVATKLGLPQELYKDIEKGKIKMDDGIAEKLSILYQAPRNIFMVDEFHHHVQAEVVYTNCTFISGSGSGNGYINHQYNDRGIDEILYFKKEEMKRLQNQIEQLQKQNSRLIELIGKSFGKSI